MNTTSVFLRSFLLVGAGLAALATSTLLADSRVDARLSIGIPLPNGYVDVVVGREHYYHYRGNFYHRGLHGYVMVRAPRGAMIRELPPRCARIYVGNVVYYRYGDVFYCAAPGGYVVVDPPAVASLPPPPPPVTEYQSVMVGSTEYLFKDGQFFQRTPEGLVWTEAPLGAITKTLPTDATSVWYQDNEYFECGNVYFRKTPDGYKVVPRPWNG
jgi:hypothetical protein